MEVDTIKYAEMKGKKKKTVPKKNKKASTNQVLLQKSHKRD